MTTRMIAFALALALGAGPALASDDDDEATLAPATEAQVRTVLVAQGYEVRSVGMEDGRIEAYAVKDGRLYELYLDANLQVVEAEEE